MFDRYLIVEDSLANVQNRAGETIGFTLGLRCGYYRRLILSQLEDIELSIDGADRSRECMMLTVGPRTYTFAELEHEYKEAWLFGQIATLFVEQPGGISPGQHIIAVRESMRVPYFDRLHQVECSSTQSMGLPRQATTFAANHRLWAKQ